jgi:diadenosine tetraphosphatase ApaH/serine/threonine PP2A family protein phosphatase
VVLEEIRHLEVERIICLGDIVGYGPEPQACLDLLRREAEVFLLGNHDAAVVGEADLENFNLYARWAVEWTQERLNTEALDFIRGFPLLERSNGFCLVHASPDQPQAWHYIYDIQEIERNFECFSESMGFIGHTHRPFIATLGAAGDVILRQGERIRTDAARRYLVNVGSVGQSRDRDPRAAFALFDSSRKELEIRRVQYDIGKTQSLMRRHGMPAFLIERLSYGM